MFNIHPSTLYVTNKKDRNVSRRDHEIQFGLFHKWLELSKPAGNSLNHTSGQLIPAQKKKRSW
jgi:hypothetical protein